MIDKMQQRNFKNSGKNFFRLLFSYVLFVFLPLIILCAVFLSVALSSFHERTMAAQQKKLEKGVERLVWCIDNITNINRSLSEDRIISSYDADDVRLSLANRDIFRRQIALYCSSNELVNDIYMHFPNERWMLTKNGPILSRFYSRNTDQADLSYNYITLDNQNFLDMAESTEMLGHFFTAERKIGDSASEQVVIFSAPVFKQGNAVSLMCIVEIKIKDLVQLLYETIDADISQAAFLIFDANEQLLYAPDNLRQLSFSACKHENVHVGKESFVVNQQPLSSIDWQIVLLTNSDLLPSLKNPSILRLLILFIVLILTSLLLMTAFMNQHYAPLHDIYKIAQQYQESSLTDGKERIRNEYQVIHGAMDEMLTRVQHYSAKEREYADILKTNFWVSVLNQKLNSEEEYIKNAQEVGIASNGQWYVLLLDYFKTDANHNDFCAFLKEKLDQQIDCFLVDFTPVHQKICIFSFATNAGITLNDLAQLCSEIVAENDLPLMIGIGSVSSTFSAISEACFEAYSAIEACQMTGKSIMRYDAIEVSALPNDRLIAGYAEEIKRAIAEENTLKVSDELNRIEKAFLQSYWPLSQIRHICFDLYSIATDALIHIGKDTGALKSSNMLTLIMNIRLQDDAIDYIDALNKQITQSLCQKKPYDLQSIIDRLQNAKEFVNPDFSFSTIAQDIGLSNSSFTRAFQKATGKLPMDYLMEMRIQYAQDLLVSTDASVMEIATQAGYYSVSSFSKRFKQITNLTPKEYRQKFRVAPH